MDIEAALHKIIEHLKIEFSGISVGRANPGMVEQIQVPVYGSPQPLKSVASVSCPDMQTIRIEPWDKSIVGSIEKAIRDANIGLNPQNMGDAVFLSVPPLTGERRQQIIKRVKEISEDSKIAVRNVRHDVLKKLKQEKDEKEISEDEYEKKEKQIQEKVNNTNKSIDEVLKKKEADILSL